MPLNIQFTDLFYIINISAQLKINFQILFNDVNLCIPLYDLNDLASNLIHKVEL